MKVLVVGGNGQLGSALKAQKVTEDIELIYVDIDTVDITDQSATDTFFEHPQTLNPHQLLNHQ